MADDGKTKPEPLTPPEPPKEEPVPSTTTTTPVLEKPKAPEGLTPEDFTPVDGPVTDFTVTVAEGERAVEAAELAYFHGTRQGTQAHVDAELALEQARANLRVARRARRY